MHWPLCLSVTYWKGFWIGFRESFIVAAHGGTEDQGRDATMLAAYQWMRKWDPDLTWAEFQDLMRSTAHSKQGGSS